jgi:hypothetical protein
VGGAIGENPGAAVGAAGTAANVIGQMTQGQPPNLQNQQMPSNLSSQLAGADPSQVAGVRRNSIGDMQSRGLAGASPDFLANETGLTPEELDQMLRRGGQS